MAYTDVTEVPRSVLLAGAAAALLVVGAFLPWSVESAGSFTGIHDSVRDGYVTLGVAVAVVATAVVLEWGRIARAVAAVGGLGAAAVFYNWYRPVADAADADPGLGLYLTLVGALGLLAAAAYGEYEARAADDEPALGVEGNGDDASL